jgi:hypothetical protein
VFSFTSRLLVNAQFMDVRIMRERLDLVVPSRQCGHLVQPRAQPPWSLRSPQTYGCGQYDKKDLLDFIQNVAVHGGIADTEHQQVRLAYNHLDVRLRMTLVEPGEKAALPEFVDQINQRKRDWFDRNDSDNELVIPRHTSVGYMEVFDEQECYMIDPSAATYLNNSATNTGYSYSEVAQDGPPTRSSRVIRPSPSTWCPNNVTPGKPIKVFFGSIVMFFDRRPNTSRIWAR